MKEIFGLFSGAYSDWSCKGYFTTSEEAEKAAIQLNRHGDDWHENYYVMPIRCLDGTKDVYKGEVIYQYSVSFSRHCGERDKDYLESEPYINVNTFADDDYRISHLFDNEGVKENLQDNKRIITNPLWSDFLECRWHTTRYLNKEEIKKIAYDMVAQWKADKAGIL